MGDRIKIKTVQVAGGIEVRALINHQMSIGLQGKGSAKFVNAHYIEEVVVALNCKTILEGDWSSGIARNPYLMWFFVLLNGFQDRARRAADQVNHGHEGLGVAIATGSGPSGLEDAVEAFGKGIFFYGDDRSLRNYGKDAVNYDKGINTLDLKERMIS